MFIDKVIVFFISCSMQSNFFMSFICYFVNLGSLNCHICSFCIFYVCVAETLYIVFFYFFFILYVLSFFFEKIKIINTNNYQIMELFYIHRLWILDLAKFSLFDVFMSPFYFIIYIFDGLCIYNECRINYLIFFSEYQTNAYVVFISNEIVFFYVCVSFFVFSLF